MTSSPLLCNLGCGRKGGTPRCPGGRSGSCSGEGSPNGPCMGALPILASTRSTIASIKPSRLAEFGIVFLYLNFQQHLIVTLGLGGGIKSYRTSVYEFSVDVLSRQSPIWVTKRLKTVILILRILIVNTRHSYQRLLSNPGSSRNAESFLDSYAPAFYSQSQSEPHSLA